MPVFNSAKGLVTAINCGDLLTLFAATDTLTAPATSIVFTSSSAGPRPIGNVQWQWGFAAAPTAVVKLYGSNNAPTAAGVDPAAILLNTSTNTQNDSYNDGSVFLFRWAVLTSQSGGGVLVLTVKAD